MDTLDLPAIDASPKPHKARVLLACGLYGKTILLATDSNWVAHEADAISNDAEDIGLGLPEDAGLWLWEGTLKAVPHGAPGDVIEVETEYTGTLRPVAPDEFAALLAMEPAETCCICGEPATTEYPPGEEDAAPSCGSPACIRSSQAGMDYHSERGG